MFVLLTFQNGGKEFLIDLAETIVEADNHGAAIYSRTTRDGKRPCIAEVEQTPAEIWSMITELQKNR